MVEKVNQDGEIDIDFVQENSLTLTDMLDDGALTARAGQQQDRFDALVAGSLGEMASVVGAQAQQRALPSHVSSEPATREGETTEAAEGGEDGEDELGASGDVDLVSESVLGMFSSWAPKVAVKAKAKAKQPQAKPAKPQASSASSVTPAKRAIPVVPPRQNTVTQNQKHKVESKPDAEASTPEKKTPECWSKAWSQLTQDVQLESVEQAVPFLIAEPHYTPIREIIDEIEHAFTKGTCGGEITLFAESKELKAECKQVGLKAKDCYTKMVALCVKLGKRKSVT